MPSTTSLSLITLKVPTAPDVVEFMPSQLTNYNIMTCFQLKDIHLEDSTSNPLQLNPETNMFDIPESVLEAGATSPAVLVYNVIGTPYNVSSDKQKAKQQKGQWEGAKIRLLSKLREEQHEAKQKTVSPVVPQPPRKMATPPPQQPQQVASVGSAASVGVVEPERELERPPSTAGGGAATGLLAQLARDRARKQNAEETQEPASAAPAMAEKKVEENHPVATKLTEVTTAPAGVSTPSATTSVSEVAKVDKTTLIEKQDQHSSVATAVALPLKPANNSVLPVVQTDKKTPTVGSTATARAHGVRTTTWGKSTTTTASKQAAAAPSSSAKPGGASTQRPSVIHKNPTPVATGSKPASPSSIPAASSARKPSINSTKTTASATTRPSVMGPSDTQTMLSKQHAMMARNNGENLSTVASTSKKNPVSAAVSSKKPAGAAGPKKSAAVASPPKKRPSQQAPTTATALPSAALPTDTHHEFANIPLPEEALMAMNQGGSGGGGGGGGFGGNNLMDDMGNFDQVGQYSGGGYNDRLMTDMSEFTRDDAAMAAKLQRELLTNVTANDRDVAKRLQQDSQTEFSRRTRDDARLAKQLEQELTRDRTRGDASMAQRLSGGGGGGRGSAPTATSGRGRGGPHSGPTYSSRVSTGLSSRSTVPPASTRGKKSVATPTATASRGTTLPARSGATTTSSARGRAGGVAPSAKKSSADATVARQLAEDDANEQRRRDEELAARMQAEWLNAAGSGGGGAVDDDLLLALRLQEEEQSQFKETDEEMARRLAAETW